jgi:Auxiliary Activity family 9 (formerly GH61)
LSITILADLSPGLYVLRHQVINLDNPIDKAQHFPQCVNIEVTGNGTQALTHGVFDISLYKADDPYHVQGVANRLRFGCESQVSAACCCLFCLL